MKKTLPKILLAVLLLLTVPTAAYALVGSQLFYNEGYVLGEEDSDSEKTVTSPTTKEKDEFLGADTITHEKDVTGDLFAAGGTVTINGDVMGNAWITGGTVNVSGKVYGDLYVGAGQVNITGDIGERLFIGSGNVTVDANVGKDIYIGAGMATLNGTYEDDVRAGVGQLTMDADIAGDLIAEVGQITKSDDTKIGGTEDVTIDKSAKGIDTGEIQLPKMKNFKFLGRRTAGAWATWKIFKGALKIVGWIIAAIIISRLCTQKTKDFMARLESGNNWLVGFGIGTLVTLVAPVLGIIFLLSIVGSPLVLLGSVVLSYLGVISGILMKIWVGNKILRLLGQDKPDMIMSSIVGVILIKIICLIPCLGFLIKVILMLIGLGVIIKLKWDMHQELKPKTV